MKNFYLIGLAGLLSCIAIPAQAALVTYNYNGTVDSGLYLGESYNGQVAFDSTSLTHTGFESVGLTSLTFNFLSNTFSLIPPVTSGATAEFLDGLFLGVNYTSVIAVDADTDLSIGFMSAAGTGLPDDLPYFAYDTTDGDSGFGSLAFVDEPLSLALLGIGLVFLTNFRRHQRC